MEQTAEEIRNSFPKMYSRELVNLLFYEFYTKIVYIEKGLHVSRKTASGYLSMLEEGGFLESQKIGKEKIYLNRRLFHAVQAAGSERMG